MNEIISHTRGYSWESKSEVLESFLNKYNSLDTISSYTKDLKDYFSFLSKVEKRDLLKVNPKGAVRFQKYLLSQGLSNSSVNRKIACIKAFYSHLIHSHIIYNNPFDIIKRLPANSKKTKALSPKEVRRLLKKMSEDTYEAILYKCLVTFYFYTGLRRSELTSLNLEDIDSLEEEDCYVRVKMKGGKIKKKYLSNEPKRILKRYLDSRKVYEPHRITGALFSTKKNLKEGKRISKRHINNIFKNIGDHFGIDLHPHMARATFITTGLNQGISPALISRDVNHKNIQTTMEYFRDDESISKEIQSKIRY
ncbi:MAG: tyrosine-type recombinase/integrase [Oligoflexia bacterium]|nr:tyrosine-type recombinase/integrase [Oligoflexia bacterium]